MNLDKLRWRVAGLACLISKVRKLTCEKKSAAACVHSIGRNRWTRNWKAGVVEKKKENVSKATVSVIAYLVPWEVRSRGQYPGASSSLLCRWDLAT